MNNETSDIIKAENIAWGDLLAGTSFLVDKGSVTVVVTAKEEVDACLTRLILGFLTPAHGKLTLFGVQPDLLPETELLQLRQRLGVIYGNGGLISNLKIWENVTLPLFYQNRLNTALIEEKGLAVLKRAGYVEKLMQLPGLTSFHQKKMAGFARAMLTDPELMIYESPLTGLNQEERRTFIKTALEFHREKAGRTSLFISSNPEIIPMLQDAKVITIHQGLQS